MKCDEVRPVCGPCTKASRACVYGSLNASPSANRRQVAHSGSIVSPEPASAHQEATLPASGVDAAAESTATGPLLAQQLHSPPGVSSPHSVHSNSTAYGVEVAPLRWYSLLAGDAATDSAHSAANLDNLSDAALVHSYGNHLSAQVDGANRPHVRFSEIVDTQSSPRASHPSVLSPNLTNENADECHLWQSAHHIQLTGRESTILERYVTGIGLWLDLFDSELHFSTFVPHLAMRNGSYQ